MPAQLRPEMRTPPARGANAEGSESRSEEIKHTQPESLSQYDEWIDTAEAYERSLAPKAHYVRKLILNLKIKREALEELGAALERNAAA